MTLSSRGLAFLLILGCTACAAPATEPAASPTAAIVTETAPPAPDATATALPAATATASAVPAPRYFTETFDKPALNWSFLQAGSAQPLAAPSTRDGFLVFDLTVPEQWGYAIYGGPSYGDVRVEAKTQFRTDGDGAAGLVCRYDEAKGWYELDVFEDQTYQLLFGQWLATGVAGYTPLRQGRSDYIQVGENSIALECNGVTLVPFVNGLPLSKWPESRFGLKVGKIGLAASSFESAPFVVAVDSVQVSEP